MRIRLILCVTVMILAGCDPPLSPMSRPDIAVDQEAAERPAPADQGTENLAEIRGQTDDPLQVV
jgi:hypothetical protein